MTIDIHQPELEMLIEQRMASGRFKNVEDVLVAALKNSPAEQQSFLPPQPEETLERMFSKVRGLFADGELDFSRDPFPGRPVDLA